MITTGTMEFLKLNAADLAIALFAVGAVLGSSAWIVGAGLVAGAQMATRTARGSLMNLGRPIRRRVSRPR